jgi:anti-anti-sigma factor
MFGTCRAAGDIDGATAPAFGADLYDTIDCSEAARVIVDCADVTFVDSAGYRVLVDATNYAVRRGRTLVIRNLSPSCARVLQLCDQDRELRVES